MKTVIVALALFVGTTVAHADYIDEQIIKAEKSVEAAQARVTKWKECAANRTECLAKLKETAQKRADSANARVAELNQ